MIAPGIPCLQTWKQIVVIVFYTRDIADWILQTAVGCCQAITFQAMFTLSYDVHNLLAGESHSMKLKI